MQHAVKRACSMRKEKSWLEIEKTCGPQDIEKRKTCGPLVFWFLSKFITILLLLNSSPLNIQGFVANLLVNMSVKEVRKSVNIWRSYGQQCSALFFFDSVYIYILHASRHFSWINSTGMYMQSWKAHYTGTLYQVRSRPWSIITGMRWSLVEL